MNDWELCELYTDFDTNFDDSDGLTKDFDFLTPIRLYTTTHGLKHSDSYFVYLCIIAFFDSNVRLFHSAAENL